MVDKISQVMVNDHHLFGQFTKQIETLVGSKGVDRFESVVKHSLPITSGNLKISLPWGLLFLGACTTPVDIQSVVDKVHSHGDDSSVRISREDVEVLVDGLYNSDTIATSYAALHLLIGESASHGRINSLSLVVMTQRVFIALSQAKGRVADSQLQKNIANDLIIMNTFRTNVSRQCSQGSYACAELPPTTLGRMKDAWRMVF